MNSSWVSGVAQLSVTAGLAAWLTGCGGSSDPGADNAIWPSNALSMVVKNEVGGFVGPAPQGSACQSGEATYALTAANRTFTWQVCQSTGSAPYTLDSGTRTLDATELDSLVSALKAVTLSKNGSCGADKSVLTLQVTTPASKHDYLDDFYSCQQAGVYVTGIDNVLQLSDTLRRQ